MKIEEDKPVLTKAQIDKAIETLEEFELTAVELYLDASALKKFYCDRAFQLSILKGYVPREHREPLVFGNAIHLYAKNRARDKSFKDSMAAGIDLYNDRQGVEPDKLIAAMTTYQPTLFPPFPTGLPPEECTELFFKFPYLELNTHTRRYIIYLCGTIDRLGVDTFENGLEYLVLIDYKSSRKYDIKTILDEYRHSIQFIFYYWVFRRFGNQILNPKLHKYLASSTTLFVSPYPVLLSHKPPRWVKGPLLNYEHMLTTVDTLINGCVEAAVQLYELGDELATPNGMMSDQCGRCDFTAVCHTPLPGKTNELIDALFNRRVYDPGNF